jgi:hypothetical protein
MLAPRWVRGFTGEEASAMMKLLTRVGTFEVSPRKLTWIVVESQDPADHARLLDIISELERREAEEGIAC